MLSILRGWRKRRRADRRLREVTAMLDRFPRHSAAPLHTLPAPLLVSLTSYPARFPTLNLTLKSLLDQSVRPDCTVLWVTEADHAKLPQEVAALTPHGLTIRTCEDLRSFKKIIPALQAYPDHFIATADDDTYYPDGWLKRLVEAFSPDEPTIVCHRAHRPLSQNGFFLPYRRWKRRVKGAWTEAPRTDLFPTGIGGVLYPPGSLPPLTTDLQLVRELSATCDDSWLYFMWRSNGWRAKRVPGPPMPFLEWPASQSESLTSFHYGGRKDEHLRALTDKFGLPL